MMLLSVANQHLSLCEGPALLCRAASSCRAEHNGLVLREDQVFFSVQGTLQELNHLSIFFYVSSWISRLEFAFSST